MKSIPGKKPVRVHLLSGDSILLVFQVKACVKDVFDQICNMYNIKDTDFFGLSAVVENEHRFMEKNQRLTKYAPKDWGKELKRRESDLSVQPTSIFTIQFQVEYFVEHPKLIRDGASRHYYYLQMKRNVIQSKVPVQDTDILSLAATSLRLDHGIYDSQIHVGEYFDPCDHVPVWFVDKWSREYLIANLPTMHRSVTESSSFNLQAEYIRKASTIDDVPVHYHKLYKTKKEENPSIVLGVFHKGIRIHQIQTNNTSNTNSNISTNTISPPASPTSNLSTRSGGNKDVKYILDLEFPWRKVGRLFFDDKRFEIYPEDLPARRKLVYYTGSKSRSKYLLRLLRETHSLYMSLSPYVQNVSKQEYRGRHFRESYISGKDLGTLKNNEREITSPGNTEKDISYPSGDAEESVVLTPTKTDREKVSKFYYSSTSHGSSHTSGIEMDQRHDDDDQATSEKNTDDDAFVDDYDIEDDALNRDDGIHDVTSDVAVEVTDRVLETGGSTKLSVSDLVGAMQLEALEIKDDGPPAPPSGPPPSSSDDPASSESTITTEFPLHEKPTAVDEGLTDAQVKRNRWSSSKEVLLSTQATSCSFASLKTNSPLTSFTDYDMAKSQSFDAAYLPAKTPVAITNDYDYTKVQSARTERRAYYDDTTSVTKSARRSSLDSNNSGRRKSIISWNEPRNSNRSNNKKQTETSSNLTMMSDKLTSQKSYEDLSSIGCTSSDEHKTSSSQSKSHRRKSEGAKRSTSRSKDAKRSSSKSRDATTPQTKRSSEHTTRRKSRKSLGDPGSTPFKPTVLRRTKSRDGHDKPRDSYSFNDDLVSSKGILV